MLQLFRADGKTFEITERVPIPSNVDKDKLAKALEGVVFLQQPNDRAIYLVNEAVDAKFEDIEDPDFEKKKRELLDVMKKVKAEKEQEEKTA